MLGLKSIQRRKLFFLFIFCLVASSSFAETSGSGKGGPFIQYHSNSVGRFDGDMKGNPVVVGGVGFGYSTKNFRLGGAGGAGFLWGSSNNVQFGLGYGGVVGDLSLASWLSARLLIGGGGYSVAKIADQTIIAQTLSKLNSGGFVLFHPALNADIPLSNMMKLGFSFGYFLPNIGELQSFTLTTSLTFGRN